MLFTIPSLKMPNVDLEGVMRQLTETGKRTQQLWLTTDSMAFIARGREYRSEFHINPSYEIQYSLKGDLHLHYRTEEGIEKIAHVPEGSCLFQPPLVPHSPRFRRILSSWSSSERAFPETSTGSSGSAKPATSPCMRRPTLSTTTAPIR